MFKHISYLLTASLFMSFSCRAVSVGDITTFINADQTHVSKTIKNTTESARFVSVNVKEITSPLKDGKEVESSNQNDLLSTPSSLILPGNSEEVFRFFYKGPKDNKERYYRLQWLDEPVSMDGETHSSKMAVATATAYIGTILVVAPRIENFSYKRDENVIKNTGNVTFRVVSYGKCANKEMKTCRERYYVMPGRQVRMKKNDITDPHTHIGIWHAKQFIAEK